MLKNAKEFYQELISQAVQHFWNTRNKQLKGSQKTEQGNRSAVTGGKQLDGFIELLVQVAQDVGVPSSCIFVKGNHLPGYFRPTKNWDFLIISPSKKLIAVIELKSQVGSFGNNFNNRTEEAIGSAIDLWTAFRENGFPQAQPPWLGYLLLVEKNKQSTHSIKIQEPHYPARKEFQGSNYLDRYASLCQKLMQERCYTSTALLWTTPEMEYGDVTKEISIDAFLRSFIGFVQGKLNELAQ